MTNMKDYRIETYRSGGNGGQNRDKVETAVRITHIPTGLAAQSQDQRSQEQNKKKAWDTLQKRVMLLERLNKLRETQAIRDKMHKGRVRTYNMISNQVTDNVRGVKFQGAKQLLDGDLDLLQRSSTG